MASPKVKTFPKEQPKFYGFIEPHHLPVKVEDRVTIPKGTKMIKANGSIFQCPIETTGKVIRISYGRSYKDWNRDCTNFNVVNVENPMLSFNTNLGVVQVDINDVVFKCE